MSDYGDEDVDYDFTWNHRVLKTTSEFEGTLEENYTIVECQYRNGEPSSCNDPFLTASSLDELENLLKQLKSALGKPVILMEDLDSVTDLDILVKRNIDDGA